MNKLYHILILVLLSLPAAAQYTTYGKVEYERKINIHRRIEELGEDQRRFYDKIKSQLAKYHLSYFDLYFTTSKAIYKPGRETENVSRWLSTPAPENVVYSDFKKDSVTAQKIIFEEKYLVQDSMREIKWRITDEIRTIANYKCRKAVGKICDSVYVVAFYTDDIMVSGGPEMFSGLPGLILELAVPRLYSTWIATKVDVVQPKEEDFKISQKGKKVNQKELFDQMNKSMEDWKSHGPRNIWWTTL
ncbi:GLPGLI family protein [Polluticoccus soli]|uniref:GLPGLI family protein n=1 Tax=Polluticoccus soli TaxID=3034150 RepID=UPI0023E1A893|nr:GLPGLI family protein [Flavipsychrobacter sp. JY13-12]